MSKEPTIKPPEPISVTQAVSAFNDTLTHDYPRIDIKGEIASPKPHQSGHLYFSLKDIGAKLDAVMWRSSLLGLDFKPEDGCEVVVRGKPEIYPPSGKLSLIVSKMKRSGAGDLQRKFLELKEKLSREGLFDRERKRALPFMPQAIGIVTSQSGAALHDIMVRLEARAPQIPVYLVDVRVQGEGAAREIAAGIEFLSLSGKVDVIIAGRGGGSIEDLWAFNEELVVRAIFASRVPVISAVGHEVDITLSDLVADLRAPTPTAAAEMVVPDRASLKEQLYNYARRLMDTRTLLGPKRASVQMIGSRLLRHASSHMREIQLTHQRHSAAVKSLEPRALLAREKLRVVDTVKKLDRGVARIFIQKNEVIQAIGNGVQRASPLSKIQQAAKLIGAKAAQLESLNPRRVLERGYAIAHTSGSGGNIIRSAGELQVGDELEVTFAIGSATVGVKKTSQ